MEEDKVFKDLGAGSEPSEPIFSIFRPKPKPKPRPAAEAAPRPVPAPQKIEPAEPPLKERLEKLSGELSALAARFEEASRSAFSRDEAAKLLESRLGPIEESQRRAEELSGRLGELSGGILSLEARLEKAEKAYIRKEEADALLAPLRSELEAAEQRLAEGFEKLSARDEENERKFAEHVVPDACVSLRVEETAVQLTALAARLDAAAWNHAEDVRKTEKRLETLEGRTGHLPARLDGLGARVEEFAVQLAALSMRVDAAAWSRAEELQQSRRRIEELERAVAALSAKSDAALMHRVEKLSADLASLSGHHGAGLAGRVEELGAQLKAFSARLDAAAWNRAEEAQRAQKRMDELEREVGRLSQPGGNGPPQ